MEGRRSKRSHKKVRTYHIGCRRNLNWIDIQQKIVFIIKNHLTALLHPVFHFISDLLSILFYFNFWCRWKVENCWGCCDLGVFLVLRESEMKNKSLVIWSGGCQVHNPGNHQISQSISKIKLNIHLICKTHQKIHIENKSRPKRQAEEKNKNRHANQYHHHHNNGRKLVKVYKKREKDLKV